MEKDISDRQPLKSLCANSINSPKKRKYTEVEDKSLDPLQLAKIQDSPDLCWVSLLRLEEQGIKPDTPVIPSVKSRIRKLTEQDGQNINRDASTGGMETELEEESYSEDLFSFSTETRRTRNTSEVTGGPTVQSILETFEMKQIPDAPAPPPPMESILSTSAVRGQLLNQSETAPSVSTIDRLRKEREQELQMVCETLDRENPWREESKRCRMMRSVDQAPVVSSNVKKMGNRIRKGRGKVNMSPLQLCDAQQSDEESTSSDVEDLAHDHIKSDFTLHQSNGHSVSFLEVCLEDNSVEEKGSGKSFSPNRKVTFALESETIPSPGYAEGDTGSCLELEGPDARNGLSPKETEEKEGNELMNSSQIIDQIFEGMLDGSEGLGESLEQDQDIPEGNEDELDLLPISILSPLAKSVNLESITTPLNSVVSSLPELSQTSLHSTDGELPAHLAQVPLVLEDSAPFYSIDAYRTLQSSPLQAGEAGIPVEVKTSLKVNTAERALDSGDLNIEDKIKALNEEVNALQRIIQQTCHALSFCVDEEHGKGTREEAEAERLLLVSTEKQLGLLNLLKCLKDENTLEEERIPSKSGPKPCRGSITISDIHLPLKVDYVCSAMCHTGRTSHYFLMLIRFGSHYIMATPLASTEDVRTGDTILFPTSVALNDIASNFEIDIEVFDLSQSRNAAEGEKRESSKPKITPKKLLNSRMKSSGISPACNLSTGSTVRISNFLLVGSLKLTLKSLGKNKFPLDKVPFLSPLEGNIYLKLQCCGHSKVEHRGFLTMFQDVGGFGDWHRYWCVLSSNCISYWTYPDQEKIKDPLGQINLANCTNTWIEAASREFCARPHTLELITMRPQQDNDRESLVTQCHNTLCFTKNWLSADTKEKRNAWMEHLNQVLVDLRTWQTGPSIGMCLPLHSQKDHNGPPVCEPEPYKVSELQGFSQ
ncbi:anillin-like isoform X2 [Rhinatrema bivittatum]|uniref:anillin-like isoform X2 n=1 Tax=Rhinatrema bivittatum TaxID=194408 RepID=UPI0011269BE2|nr:anillin-like isoform X2 [Rhinatrema bivittatum]